MHADAQQPSEDLARHAQAGSSGAFAELVSRHERAVFHFLLIYSKDMQEAEDLTQEAFVRAWEKIASYDPRRRFSTWLFTLAKRRAISLRRKLRPHPVAEEVLEGEARALSPLDELELSECKRNLWVLARRVLSPDQLSALWLRYAEEQSAREIARILGRREATVRVMLFRARGVLARHLSPDGDCPGRPERGSESSFCADPALGGHR